MDFNSIKESAAYKRAMHKIRIVGFAVVVIEAVCWYVMVMWLGPKYAVPLMVVLLIVGWMIRPESSGFFKGMERPRKLVSLLLMLPLWMTKLLIPVVVIGPLRRVLMAWVLQKAFGVGMRRIFGDDGGLASNPNDSNDFIDAEHEVLDDVTRVKVNRTVESAKPLEAEVIDVEHEWRE